MEYLLHYRSFKKLGMRRDVFRKYFLLVVILKEPWLYINKFDDLIKSDLGFNSCDIPIVILFHVVRILNYFCTGKVTLQVLHWKPNIYMPNSISVFEYVASSYLEI